MKFAKHLEAESVSEWRRAYINYKGLKKRLTAIEKYRHANTQALETQIKNAQLKNTLHQLVNDPTVSLETTSAQHHPEQTGNVIRRLKRYNTTPTDFEDYRQERQDSFSKSIVDRISSSLFGDGTELASVDFHRASLEGNVLDQVLTLTNEPERYFFAMLDQELEKISRFYKQKEQEAMDKFDALKMQLELIRQYRRQLLAVKQSEDEPIEQRLNPMHWFHSRKPLNSTAPTSDSTPSILLDGDHHMSYRVARSRLKTAITEYYRSLELLRSYKILNEMGFQKILKKFDKTAGWKASAIYDKKLKTYHWVTSEVLDDIIKDTERLFVREFSDGHRRKGMKKLRLPDNDEEYSATTWRIGFSLGACLTVFARVIQLALDPLTQQKVPLLFYNLNIYSFIILPILFTILFSINMAVWHKCHINYRFIFELDPRNCLDYRQFAELPSFMLLLTAVIMYIDFSQCFAPSVPSQMCPLILVVILLSILFCPFQLFYRSARQWIGATLGRIALSGLLPVEFRDFFIADELNSMAFSFWMGVYLFCVYGWHWNDLDLHCNVPKMWVTPVLASLPPLWRGLQCLRRYHDSKEKHHLVNGLKYVTSIMATLFTGVRRIAPSPVTEVAWILISIVNSSYTSIWDIKMDWGLLDVNSSNFLLRDDLVFYKWTYYIAVPLNIFLRFSWAINKAGLAYHSQIITFATALLEVVRRIIWNFFRLENEHLNNCGNYRAIKEIPLPFALKESHNLHDDEEGGIQLPVNHEDPENPSPATSSTVTPDILTNDNVNSISSMISPDLGAGTFYGRRDFETRQDKEDHKLGLPTRQSTVVGHVLDRIRTLGASADSDSEIDDDDDDDGSL